MSTVSVTGQEAGVELGYAQKTSDTTNATTTFADIAGLTTTVTTGTRPILVVFYAASASNGTSAGGVTVNIMEDGVDVGQTSQIFNTTTNFVPFNLVVRRNPTAGSHTYKCQLKAALAGTATLTATGGAAPTFIQVIQI